MRPDELASWPNHELSRIVEAGGMRWHVQQSGHGPTLLLLHGAGASTHSWRDLMPRLAPHFRIIALDLPGHGFTSAAPGHSSIGEVTARVAELLTALGVSPDYCVGHSAGAVILARLALDRRIGAARIVAINGAFLPLGGFASLWFAPLAQLLAGTTLLPRLIAGRLATPARIGRLLEGTGSRLDRRGAELYLRLMRDPDHVAGTLRMMSDWDLATFAGELPRLATPLTLLVGDHDRAIPPAQADAVRARLPSSTLHSLPGLGHLAHEEAPDVVARQILRACE